ncbi:MAG TPA: sigma-70 family RNA polymerase sigma factor [Cyclobacteriaceae bacterium]|nr:sigma-70 family RNA polymerase sigma factor [Cyclobacteriaceae bacterium]
MKSAEQYSDAEVIQKILNGERALFEILIRRNNAALYKTGRSYNYSHADTQDLMQETFINAFLNLAKYEHRSSFKTWIVKIMLNNCFRKQQKFSFKNEIQTEMEEASEPMFASEHGNTNKVIMNRELNTVIEKALLQLPLDYRLVFSMREANGFNVHETATALNISEANVKVRLNRAKAMLRKEVEKSYSSEDIFEFNLVYCDAMVSSVMAKLAQLQAPLPNLS